MRRPSRMGASHNSSVVRQGMKNRTLVRACAISPGIVLAVIKPCCEACVDTVRSRALATIQTEVPGLLKPLTVRCKHCYDEIIHHVNWLSSLISALHAASQAHGHQCRSNHSCLPAGPVRSISEAALWYGLRMLERAGGGVRQTIKAENAYERRLLSEVLTHR